MKPLTRDEVEKYKKDGFSVVTSDRVLALLDERDALKADLAKMVKSYVTRLAYETIRQDRDALRERAEKAESAGAVGVGLRLELSDKLRLTESHLADALAQVATEKQQVQMLLAHGQRLEAQVAALMTGMEIAWGVIANAEGGNWKRGSQEWRGAAERWRDEHWHPAVKDLSKVAEAFTAAIHREARAKALADFVAMIERLKQKQPGEYVLWLNAVAGHARDLITKTEPGGGGL